MSDSQIRIRKRRILLHFWVLDEETSNLLHLLVPWLENRTSGCPVGVGGHPKSSKIDDPSESGRSLARGSPEEGKYGPGATQGSKSRKVDDPSESGRSVARGRPDAGI